MERFAVAPVLKVNNPAVRVDWLLMICAYADTDVLELLDDLVLDDVHSVGTASS